MVAVVPFVPAASAPVASPVAAPITTSTASAMVSAISTAAVAVVIIIAAVMVASATPTPAIAIVAAVVLVVAPSALVAAITPAVAAAMMAAMMATVMATVMTTVTVVMMRVVPLSMRIGDQGPISVLHVGVLLTTSTVLALAPRRVSFVGTDLVPNLASRFSTPELPVRLEAIVPVDANHATVEHGSVEGVDGERGFSPCRVLHETEAAGLHFDPIEPHDQVHDLPASREKLEQLALQREE